MLFRSGSTDSELMFFLALTFGLEDDPIGGIEQMAGFVEKTARANGVDQSLWMTLGFTDGNTLYAVRYASDGDAPTLFHTSDTEHLYRLNKSLRGALGKETRLVVSEPIGNTAEAWVEIPQNTAVTFHAGEVTSRAFHPQTPT